VLNYFKIQLNGGAMTKCSHKLTDIVRNFQRISQAVNEYERIFEHLTGLTAPQFWALKILSAHGSMCVSDLAVLMYLRSATVVGIIDRLERKNLVIRNRSEKDRRVVYLNLTVDGEKLAKMGPQSIQSLFLRGLEPLTEEQFTSLFDGVRLMAQILEREKMVPPLLHRTPG
jgi:DNA-binding MarR family transcriptional regulator